MQLNEIEKLIRDFCKINKFTYLNCIPIGPDVRITIQELASVVPLNQFLDDHKLSHYPALWDKDLKYVECWLNDPEPYETSFNNLIKSIQPNSPAFIGKTQSGPLTFMKEDNIVRDKSYAFARRCVRLYKYLCEEKKEFILSKQLVRCGTSIGANIIEGQFGQSRADFAAKLSIAQKEAGETEFWLKL